MNKQLRGMALALLCFIVVGTWLEARAEVSVRTDRNGRYVMTQVVPGGSHIEPQVWTVVGKRTRRSHVLNPMGDRYGDLWPTIADQSVSPFTPWVIWSRRDGQGFDLAWSRWSRQGWSATAWVEDLPSPGHDLDARLGFDSEGRPHIVWWRADDDGGKIYLSIYLIQRWMVPYLVSDPEMHSHHPEIEIEADGVIRVNYDTAEGAVSQTVYFQRPVTITDDINPQSTLSMENRTNPSAKTRR